MLVTLLFMLSSALIGAGAALLLREWVGRKRFGFLPQWPTRAPQPPEAEAEITIAPARVRLDAARAIEATPPPAASPVPQPIAQPVPAPHPPHDAGNGLDGSPAPWPDPDRLDAAGAGDLPAQPVVPAPMPDQRVQLWTDIEPRLAEAVMRANAKLERDGPVILGLPQPFPFRAPGDCGITYPVRLADKDIAWLRLEIDFAGDLTAHMTSLAEQTSPGNGSARLSPSHQAAADLDRLLADCLAPLLAAAQPPAVLASPTPIAHHDTGDDDAQLSSARAWQSSAATVASALRATNGAFAQVDARLVDLGQAQWDAAQRRHRLTLSLHVAGEDVARLHVDRLAHEIEIAVTGKDSGAKDLGRRRRVPTDGMSVQGLAELIAGCAWPTVARAREKRQAAGPA